MATEFTARRMPQRVGTIDRGGPRNLVPGPAAQPSNTGLPTAGLSAAAAFSDIGPQPPPFAWGEVQGSKEFDAAEAVDQFRVKRAYFKQYVAPTGKDWDTFEYETGPNIGERVMGGVYGMIGGLEQTAALGAKAMGRPDLEAGLQARAKSNEKYAARTAYMAKYGEHGWEQIKNLSDPEWWKATLATMGPSSAPFMAGALTGAGAGALAGSAVPVVGTVLGALIGGIIGGGGAAALQELGPAYYEYLEKNPGDEEGATEYASLRAGLSGILNAASIPLGGAGMALGPLRHTLVQMVVQGNVGMADQLAQNWARRDFLDPTQPLSEAMVANFIGEAVFEAPGLTAAMRSMRKIRIENALNAEQVLGAETDPSGMPNRPNPEPVDRSSVVEEPAPDPQTGAAEPPGAQVPPAGAPPGAGGASSAPPGAGVPPQAETGIPASEPTPAQEQPNAGETQVRGEETPPAGIGAVVDEGPPPGAPPEAPAAPPPLAPVAAQPADAETQPPAAGAFTLEKVNDKLYRVNDADGHGAALIRKVPDGRWETEIYQVLPEGRLAHPDYARHSTLAEAKQHALANVTSSADRQAAWAAPPEPTAPPAEFDEGQARMPGVAPLPPEDARAPLERARDRLAELFGEGRPPMSTEDVLQVLAESGAEDVHDAYQDLITPLDREMDPQLMLNKDGTHTPASALQELIDAKRKAEPAAAPPAPPLEPAIKRPAAQIPPVPEDQLGKPRPVVDGKIETASGRWIPAPPQIRTDTNRKATKDLQAQRQWLTDQVQAEAKARGDDFNQTGFSGLNPKNWSQADGDSASLYLFGEVDAVFELPEETPAAKPPEGKEPAAAGAEPSDFFAAMVQRLNGGWGPKNNHELRRAYAEHVGKNPGEVSAGEMKSAQEAFEAAQASYLRRKIAGWQEEGLSDLRIYDELVQAYKRQPNLDFRTSTSVINQAYSTPAPLAFLIDRLAGMTSTTLNYEPSAGNGLLVLAGEASKTQAIELEPDRVASLEAQDFDVSQGDGTTAVASGRVKEGTKDVVIANPPFGPIPKEEIQGHLINQIDHKMIMDALGALKDDGRAAFIIGADKVSGIVQRAHRPFFNWLYHHYNVTGHFELEGDLYGRQGAGWPVRVITVDGRKAEPAGFFPREAETRRAYTWEEVFDEYRRTARVGAAERVGPDAGAEPAAKRPAAPKRAPTPPAPGGEDTGRAAGGRGAGEGQEELPKRGGEGGEQPGGPGSGAAGELPGAAGPRPGGLGARGEPGAQGAGAPPERGGRGGAAPQPEPAGAEPGGRVGTAPGWGESNKLVTKERYDELLKRMREKLDTEKAAGLDPESMQITAELVTFHVEAGARKFSEVVSALLEALGDKIRPYLAGAYLNAKQNLRSQGESVADMDSEAAVQEHMDALAEPRTESAKKSAPKTPSTPAVADAEARTAPVEEATEFQAPYMPRSKMAGDDVLVPVNMVDPLQRWMERLEEEVGPLDEYLRDKLGYTSDAELGDALMHMQVDSVAAAIYQLERGSGFIIADQTGVGKGRQGAALARYAARNGMVPVYFTVGDNNFSDVHRDMDAIGSGGLRPWMFNEKGRITDDNGDLVYDAPQGGPRRRAFRTDAGFNDQMAKSDYVLLTYSQVRRSNAQRNTLRKLVADRSALVILDEAHHAAGDSATGEFMSELLAEADAVAYMSATYAKRPDNMGIYFRTDISKAVGDKGVLADAFRAGGLPLQTVVSNMLAESGQLMRRERSMKGVHIEPAILSERREEHEQTSDTLTHLLRRVLQFDVAFQAIMGPIIQVEADEGGTVVADSGQRVTPSVDHTGFASQVHNNIRQLLYGLKVDEVGRRAVESLRAGEKVVIAVENTMESFLTEYVAGKGLSQGHEINADFRDVIRQVLARTSHFNITLPGGQKDRREVAVSEYPLHLKRLYDEVLADIEKADINLPISPIDAIRQQIEAAGFKTGEITGRTLFVDYSGETTKLSHKPAEEKDKTAMAREFNNGGIDALVLNVAGSTGISLHASERFKDQRPRHMLIAQPALAIDTFMQMMGRIHRTGQVALPRYTLLASDIPAENRPMAVLSKKLQSLNANTSSNTKSDTSFDAPDFLNQYGDQIINDYLAGNSEMAEKLMIGSSSDPEPGVSMKASGRVAMLTIADQRLFYEEIIPAYNDHIKYLDQTGQNDLVPRTLDFDAKVTQQALLVAGDGSGSLFGEDATYQRLDIKRQGKPPKPGEVVEAVTEALGGEGAAQKMDAFLDPIQEATDAYIEGLQADLAAKIEAAQAALEEATALSQEELRAASRDQTDPDPHVLAATKEAQEKMNALRWRESALTHIVVASRDNLTRARSIQIGYGFQIEVDEELINAVVVGHRSHWKPGAAGNPAAPSKFVYELMVNTGQRKVSLPLTQLIRVIKSNAVPNPPTSMWFSESVSTRDRAHVIVGNLLAGFGAVQRGRVITFTAADGTSRMGIRLPNNFNLADDAKVAVSLRTSEQVLRYLDAVGHDRVGVVAADKSIRIYQGDLRDGSKPYFLTVATRKSIGAKWHRDAALQEILGQEFAWKRGQDVVRVQLRDRAHLEEVVAHVVAKQPLEAAPSLRDLANRIVQQTTGQLPEGAAEPAGQVPGAPQSRATLATTRPTLDVAALKARLEAQVGPKVTLQLFDKSAPNTEENIAGWTDAARGVVALSYWAHDPKGVIDHEAWHYVLDTLSEPQRELVQRKYAEGTQASRAVERQMARRGYKPALADAAYLDWEERSGYAYQFHRQGEGKQKAGLGHIFNRLTNFLERVYNAVRGLGFETAQDLFDATSRGEKAGGTPQGYNEGALPQARQPTVAPAREMPTAPRKLTDKLFNIPFRLIPVHKAYGWVADQVLARVPEKVKAGLFDRFGETDEMKGARLRFRQATMESVRLVRKSVEKLMVLDRGASRVAYNWLTTNEAEREAALLDQLPDEIKQDLRDLKTLIHDLGLEAVRLKLVTQDSFDRNKMAYLRRAYLKHELNEDGSLPGQRRRAIKVLGDNLKGRGIKEEYNRVRLLENVGPEWWQRNGARLIGQKFVRHELRAKTGKLRTFAYTPVGEAIPDQFQGPGWAVDAMDDGTPNLWEARWAGRTNATIGLWRDLSEQERRDLGEIDEVKYAVARTLMGMLHDIETARYFEHIATNPHWTVSDPGLIPEGGVLAASATKRGAYLPHEWIQVPDTRILKTPKVKVYGELAGKWVSAPIWNEIRNVADWNRLDRWKWYSDLIRAFKVSKTALSPTTHINNTMANLLFAEWADVRASSVVSALSTYIKAWSGDAAAKEALDDFTHSGAGYGTFAEQELRDEVVEPLRKALAEEAARQGVDHADGHALSGARAFALVDSIIQGLRAGVGKAVDLYQLEDNVFRLAAFQQALAEGKTTEEAAAIATDAFLDYDINAPWVNVARQSALPFIAFSYRAIPKLHRLIKEKPYKLLKLTMIMGALNAASYAFLGSDGDEEEERRLLPPERKGKIFGMFPRMLRMPWNHHGEPLFLDIVRWVPAGDLFLWQDTKTAVPILPFLVPGGPLEWGMEFLANKDFYTGEEITSETDTPAQAGKKVALHLWKGIVPNAVLVPYSYSYDKVFPSFPEGVKAPLRAVGLGSDTPNMDPFGREYPSLIGVLNAFGFKLAVFPGDVAKMRVMQRANAHIREIEMTYKRAARSHMRGGIDRAELEAHAAVAREKIERIARQVRDTIVGPQGK